MCACALSRLGLTLQLQPARWRPRGPTHVVRQRTAPSYDIGPQVHRLLDELHITVWRCALSRPPMRMCAPGAVTAQVRGQDRARPAHAPSTSRVSSLGIGDVSCLFSRRWWLPAERQSRRWKSNFGCLRNVPKKYFLLILLSRFRDALCRSKNSKRGSIASLR